MKGHERTVAQVSHYRDYHDYSRYDSDEDQGPYSRTSYDISWASDWSRWPSQPIRSPRYIVTCARIRAQPYINPIREAAIQFNH